VVHDLEAKARHICASSCHQRSITKYLACQQQAYMMLPLANWTMAVLLLPGGRHPVLLPHLQLQLNTCRLPSCAPTSPGCKPYRVSSYVEAPNS
jgi:hypothetical protein